MIHALLLGLILLLLMSTITLFLICPGNADLAEPTMFISGALAMVLAVGLMERRTEHTGEKP